jgi:hypothetical protein
LAVALNGAMAHVYLRPEGSTGWDARATERELGIVAEILRLYLTNGQRFVGSARSFQVDTDHPAFEVGSYETLSSAIGIPRLAGGPQFGVADMILVRTNPNGLYRIYNGLQPVNPGNDPQEDVSMELLPLSAVLNGSEYVQAIERIQAQNHEQRSGDIIVLMRMNEAPRFTTGVACRGWHASLNRSDSYVPFILSYPGGNANVVEQIRDEICASGDACKQNWVLPEFVKKILKEQED